MSELTSINPNEIEILFLRERVSNESLTENAHSFALWAGSNIRKFYEEISERFRFKPSAYKKNTKVLNKINEIDYSLLIDFEIDTPSALSNEQLAMLQNMRDIGQALNNIYDRIIDPYKHYSAWLLSNPKELNVMIPNTKAVGKIRKLNNVDKLREKLLSDFSGKEKIHTNKFGEIYKSTGDFIRASEILEEISISLNKVDLKKIVNGIEEAYEYNNMIFRHIETGNEQYAISKAMGIYLHNLTTLVAKEIELYSLYRYRLQSTIVAFQKTEKRIASIR